MVVQHHEGLHASAMGDGAGVAQVNAWAGGLARDRIPDPDCGVARRGADEVSAFRSTDEG